MCQNPDKSIITNTPPEHSETNYNHNICNNIIESLLEACTIVYNEHDYEPVSDDTKERCYFVKKKFHDMCTK